MIVYTGHSPRYIAIAAPDPWECVPTFFALNPNLSSLMAQTASLRATTISSDVTCSILWFFNTANRGLSPVDPVYFSDAFLRCSPLPDQTKKYILRSQLRYRVII